MQRQEDELLEQLLEVLNKGWVIGRYREQAEKLINELMRLERLLITDEDYRVRFQANGDLIHAEIYQLHTDADRRNALKAYRRLIYLLKLAVEEFSEEDQPRSPYNVLKREEAPQLLNFAHQLEARVTALQKQPPLSEETNTRRLRQLIRVQEVQEAKNAQENDRLARQVAAYIVQNGTISEQEFHTRFHPLGY